MKYPKAVSVPSVTGAVVPQPSFRAWQPSTWPSAPSKWEPGFVATIRAIFQESILTEINNVVADAGGNLEHRGYVIAIALLCALDAISSYGYGAKNGKQIPDFIRAHFPEPYKSHAEALLRLYRHEKVHSWNLFKVAILPGNETVAVDHGVISFGLLNFLDAVSEGANGYLKKLETDKMLQRETLERYRKLKGSAKK